jgi:hypothetical protein
MVLATLCCHVFASTFIDDDVFIGGCGGLGYGGCYGPYYYRPPRFGAFRGPYGSIGAGFSRIYGSGGLFYRPRLLTWSGLGGFYPPTAVPYSGFNDNSRVGSEPRNSE